MTNSSDRASDKEKALTVVVIGASGDLARKKIFPALFSLYSQDLLPAKTNFVGFSRSDLSPEEFREKLREHLACRYLPRELCGEKMGSFLSLCHYVPGQYDSADAFLDLYQAMRGIEDEDQANRIFYMAIPPSLFLDVSRALGASGLVSCGDHLQAWSRAVIEKPFGHDRASSDELVAQMAQIFTESETYRIDHYLGKEVIQNLIVLRFANQIFEPLWNRSYIESVWISFDEDFGAEGRGGYFDRYGIVRDVMQNHLTQILALVAMERPRRLDAIEILNEKVKVLRAVAPLKMEDFVLGQYVGSDRGGVRRPGYLDEESVPSDSTTPTYAATVIRVDNDRWRGVPFIVTAGKALERRATEIRVLFRRSEENLFKIDGETPPPNELVIRVQPDEAIYFRTINKVPGLRMRLAECDLNLRYAQAFSGPVPEAYESLILDVIRGDKSLFIRKDELETAWDIFTPALHEAARGARKPEPYEYGSEGPEGALELIRKFRSV
ncbi:glucose-6-phosphate dehydrogenase [Candidatus Sumerlaeota bacterium]|nr:glucose-6-phosphate dehydrogenase [Candidatus Sumerlaeota bacterium]